MGMNDEDYKGGDFFSALYTALDRLEQLDPDLVPCHLKSDIFMVVFELTVCAISRRPGAS